MHIFTSTCLAVVFSITIINTEVDALGGPKGYYSNEWILRTRNGRSDARAVADKYGFHIIAETSKGYFILRKIDSEEASLKPDERFASIAKDSKDEYLQQLKYLNRIPRTLFAASEAINNSYWSSMWHVHEDTFPSMGIYDAWNRGYSGAGIRVSVLDDGIEPDHPDLIENYDVTGSYDYLSDSNYVNHTDSDFHGTWCAGLVAASMDEHCVLGMAYMSKFGAVKIFDAYYGLTDPGEALALVHDLPRTDIYSNSWGPADTGGIFDGPGDMAREALLEGATAGRGGLGAIYTWAAGNGGVYDDCNCDGFANSIYTIAVTSIGKGQAPAYYSEECSNILAGTYSGDHPDLTIATTDTGGSCTTFFQGTSASCPIAAGIIALVLEANPSLSWRDVQHLIVETSATDGLIRADWQVNGAGYRVSHSFGFGLMNAAAMVDTALDWTLVETQAVCESETIVVNSISNNGVYIISKHVSDGCTRSVQYMEHVEVSMTFQTTYRGSLQVTLISPSGTRSRLLRPRIYDYYNGTTEWTFMTVHCWGEMSAGSWQLQLETSETYTEFGLTSWKLVLYGTENPSANNPLAQVSQEPISDDDDAATAIVGGVLGGVILIGVVAAVVYILKFKTPKDPTIYPTGVGGPANSHY